jgi:hypothetical protein
MGCHTSILGDELEYDRTKPIASDCVQYLQGFASLERQGTVARDR